MSEFKSLSNYAKAARLWVISYEDSISEHGVANTLSGKYYSIESLHRDVAKQLKNCILGEQFEMDITEQEALDILLNRKSQ